MNKLESNHSTVTEGICVVEKEPGESNVSHFNKQHRKAKRSIARGRTFNATSS